MPGLLLHVGAMVQCTHFVPAMVVPAQTRVLVSGQPIATASSTITIAGCPFPPPPATPPQPCLRVQWTMLSARVLVGGQPALLQPSPGVGMGLCLNPTQAPNGPPQVTSLQTRVVAS
ncbi:MAG: hypothetical protein ABW252_03715 [Polyangiales bacterium]